MTTDELIEIIENEDDGLFLTFDQIANKKSERPDLHAFLLLDGLLPSNRDMVCAAEHDLIVLDVDLDELAKVISIDQATELKRCGVWVWEDESLAMFV